MSRRGNAKPAPPGDEAAHRYPLIFLSVFSLSVSAREHRTPSSRSTPVSLSPRRSLSICPLKLMLQRIAVAADATAALPSKPWQSIGLVASFAIAEQPLDSLTNRSAGDPRLPSVHRAPPCGWPVAFYRRRRGLHVVAPATRNMTYQRRRDSRRGITGITVYRRPRTNPHALRSPPPSRFRMLPTASVPCVRSSNMRNTVPRSRLTAAVQASVRNFVSPLDLGGGGECAQGRSVVRRLAFYSQTDIHPRVHGGAVGGGGCSSNRQPRSIHAVRRGPGLVPGTVCYSVVAVSHDKTWKDCEKLAHRRWMHAEKRALSLAPTG